MKQLLVVILTLVLVSRAGGKSTGINLHKYRYSQLTGWNNSNIAPGFVAFKKSCAALNSSKVQSSKLFSNNNNVWSNKCRQARIVTNPQKFFESNFTPYLVSNGKDPKGKFTGYFEKEIEASLRKDSVYKYPIYSAPKDPKLLNLTRRQIDNGALEGKGLEIAYAKSAARLFFLHIQGSGILKLPDGRRLEVGFAGKNTAQYTGIGSYMLTQGMIKHGSAEDIIAWLEARPVSGRTVMNRNDRYVFFALKNGGPYGSMGIELTDGASLAVDPAYIPLGTPMWLQTTLPITKQYFTKLMNAQDTGSAIKGPIRGDIFFGEGAWAANTASGMNAVGNYFVMIPNEIDPDPYF